VSADALKEHVSNAIDEHLKAQLNGSARASTFCGIGNTLQRRDKLGPAHAATTCRRSKVNRT
jgi:hypothetical protein